MIDWNHPRIYERLRCFGLALFTLGISSHNVDSPAIALAAILVTAMLVYRLKLELAIARNEDEAKLETKLHRIQQINQWMLVPIVVGCLGFMRKAASGSSLLQ
jgi:hypothetical protein